MGSLLLYWSVSEASLFLVAQGPSPVTAGGSLGAEALRGTMTPVSGAAAAIKTWPCPKDILLQGMPFL